MSLLVPRAPVQDGPSPTAQQDLHTTCITTLRSREARCSKLLGEAAFSCLVRTAKTGCGQKKVTFCGVSLQSCLFVHSQCFYLLEALLSRATVPGISTHADFFFFLQQSSQDLIYKPKCVHPTSPATPCAWESQASSSFQPYPSHPDTELRA